MHLRLTERFMRRKYLHLYIKRLKKSNYPVILISGFFYV